MTKKSEKPVARIAVNHVSKVYNDVLGLNDVSLNIFPGITGLLGPNGAGKSTLIKTMLGLVIPTSGNITIDGMPVMENREILSKIGYVPEHDSFEPGMTGLEHVQYYLRLSGKEKVEAEKTAGIILDKLELGDAAQRKIKTYSKGMKQKVKLAAAISHKPEILILDEPLNGSDPKSRRLIIENILYWNELGNTVIVSSHILKEIEKLTRNIILINRGKVFASGDIHTLRDMMNAFPHRIIIELDNEDNRKKFATMLFDSGLVKSVILDDKNLRRLDAETSRPGIFFREFPKFIHNLGIAVEQYYSRDDNLEALYRYLIEGGAVNMAGEV